MALNSGLYCMRKHRGTVPFFLGLYYKCDLACESHLCSLITIFGITVITYGHVCGDLLAYDGGFLEYRSSYCAGLTDATT